jgi:hypothetical protein
MVGGGGGGSLSLALGGGVCEWPEDSGGGGGGGGGSIGIYVQHRGHRMSAHFTLMWGIFRPRSWAAIIEKNH